MVSKSYGSLTRVARIIFFPYLLLAEATDLSVEISRRIVGMDLEQNTNLIDSLVFLIQRQSILNFGILNYFVFYLLDRKTI